LKKKKETHQNTTWLEISRNSTIKKNLFVSMDFFSREEFVKSDYPSKTWPEKQN